MTEDGETLLTPWVFLKLCVLISFVIYVIDIVWTTLIKLTNYEGPAHPWFSTFDYMCPRLDILDCCVHTGWFHFKPDGIAIFKYFCYGCCFVLLRCSRNIPKFTVEQQRLVVCIDSMQLMDTDRTELKRISKQSNLAT